MVGRDSDRGYNAVQEVCDEHPSINSNNNNISFDWRNNKELRALLADGSTSCLIHTAGPFLDEKPTPLQAAIELGCKAYIDVSDPLDYLEESQLMNDMQRTLTVVHYLLQGHFQEC